MAKTSNDSNGGHIQQRGGQVFKEDRPPGPVTMQHLRRLGDNTAALNNPNGVGPVSKKSTINNGDGW